MIIDASALLAAFLVDEDQPQAQALVQDHVDGKTALSAPTLLMYEFCNSIRQAERRGRVRRDQADDMITAVEELEIALEPLAWGEMLPLARQFDLTVYDAAYLALAQSRGEALITGDRPLYTAARALLPSAQWIGDYPGTK